MKPISDFAKDATLFIVVYVLCFSMWNSCWRHQQLDDGKVQYAWHVEAPGYQETWHRGPPENVTKTWSWDAVYYRIGPWIDLK